MIGGREPADLRNQVGLDNRAVAGDSAHEQLAAYLAILPECEIVTAGKMRERRRQVPVALSARQKVFDVWFQFHAASR